MFDEEKYVVFKREDYESAINDTVDLDVPSATKAMVGVLDRAQLPAESCFVLRAGDILAQVSLRSYVSNALSILELAKAGVADLSEAELEHLTDVADGAAGLADVWETHPHKIPD